MSQNHDLHRALLRPAVIHILRAAGFQSTKPSVLDTLVNITERHILLLASTTAQHALLSHNDSVPSISDVRMALADCGVLYPLTNPSEEAWKERMRKPLTEVADVPRSGRHRMVAQKRKRDEEDTRDVRDFTKWYDSTQHKEAKRIAGMIPDAGATGVLPAVGVGGGVVQAEDFLTALKKRYNKAGDDSRLRGTVLLQDSDDRVVLIEGGPVQFIRDWKPKSQERSPNERDALADADREDSSLSPMTDEPEPPDEDMEESGAKYEK